MTQLLDIYKCNVCGNIVSIMHIGGGKLTCCNQEMEHLVENTVDAAKEKHVPVLEKTNDGYEVKVGSVAHPMLPEHYIEWIELIGDSAACVAFLKPGAEPKATFCSKDNNVMARDYCNLHGLWKA